MVYLLKVLVTKILINHNNSEWNFITLIWTMISEVEIEETLVGLTV